MRLTRIEVTKGVLAEPRSVVIRFRHNGVSDELVVSTDEVPPNNRRDWAEAQINAYLSTHTLEPLNEIIYPNMEIVDRGANDFDSLPGWATWTAAQAGDWIEENVIDLASAKSVLIKMAQAIVYLRDIVIER